MHHFNALGFTTWFYDLQKDKVSDQTVLTLMNLGRLWEFTQTLIGIFILLKSSEAN